MILVFSMLSFKPAFSLSCFTFNRRLFSFSLLSAIKVVSSAYLRLLIFLPAVLTPACTSTSLALHMMHSAYKHSFPNSEPVPTSMSVSNCCFLSCIQVSQETGKMVWYSHLLKNFPQFVVIHTVKGFGIVNKTEVDVFLELYCFFNDSADVGNFISVSSALSKFSLNIWMFMYC